MAPSELGQPKAPDKWDSKANSSDVGAIESGPQQREAKPTNTSQQDTKVMKQNKKEIK